MRQASNSLDAVGVDDGLHRARAVHLAEDPLLFGGQADLARGAGRGALAARRARCPPSPRSHLDLSVGSTAGLKTMSMEGIFFSMIGHSSTIRIPSIRMKSALIGAEVLAVVVDGVAGREVVLAVAPAEDLEHDLRHLDRERVLEVLLRDVALRDQDVARAAAASASASCSASSRRSLAELALLDEHVAQPVLEPLGDESGMTTMPFSKETVTSSLSLLERQEPGLPLQADELEDVGEPEVLDRALRVPWLFLGGPARARARAAPAARWATSTRRTRAHAVGHDVERPASTSAGQPAAPGRRELADEASVSGSRRPAQQRRATMTGDQTTAMSRLRAAPAARRGARRPGTRSESTRKTRSRARRPPPAPRAACGCAPGPRRRRARRTGDGTACRGRPPPARGGSCRQKAVPHLRQRSVKALRPRQRASSTAGEREDKSEHREAVEQRAGQQRRLLRIGALPQVLGRRRRLGAPANLAHTSSCVSPRSTTA